MHLRRHLLALTTFSLALASCDETPGVNLRENPPPQLTQFSITPGDVQFQRETDGVKDTTIVFQMSVGHHGGALDMPPEYILTDTDTELTLDTGTLSDYDAASGRYSGGFSMSTNTNLFRNFEIVVFARNGEQELGNRIVRKLSLRGIPGIRPLMDSATVDPDTVTRPPSGSTEDIGILFSSVVLDEDGPDNVDQAYLSLISLTTGPVGTPIVLTRGSADGNKVSFSTQLFINANNSADEYRILFFADDKSGLRSDTLERRFVVR